MFFYHICYSVFKEPLRAKLSKLNRKQPSVCEFFLLRKEVIHPHVPVGIPCYDLTPVTYPTLAGPLLYRLGYQLQVLQASMA